MGYQNWEIGWFKIELVETWGISESVQQEILSGVNTGEIISNILKIERCYQSQIILSKQHEVIFLRLGCYDKKDKDCAAATDVAFISLLDQY